MANARTRASLSDDNLLPQEPVRITVAISGGVDSAVAAYLLAQAGHQVTAVMARLLPQTADAAFEQARRSAHAVCDHLQIPLTIIDLRDAFQEQVIDYFISAYVHGHTPNPCIACNEHIKFGALLDWAMGQNQQLFATGHYARKRLVQDRYQLARGLDRNKDQSYFLYRLDQTALTRILFPLGALTKDAVRQIARRAALPAAHRAESQEICFVPDNDYRAFLQKHRPEAVQPGPIYDTAGRQIGQHQGLPFYTIGQRKGLGIAAAQPLYVLSIDMARNSLIVGPQEALGRKRLIADDVRIVSGEWPATSLQVQAKIRYQAKPAPATVTPCAPAQVCVKFERPLRDITPGQAVVFYQGEVVLGGGIIA